MKVGDIEGVLHDAAALRMPRLLEHDGAIAKVSALEDYLVETAIWRGQLEEARLFTYEAHDKLMAEWDDIEGWEMLVTNGSRRTQDDIRRAKKKIRPDLATSIPVAKHLIARLSEQIRRLEKDDEAASRLYTMVTGG